MKRSEPQRIWSFRNCAHVQSFVRYHIKYVCKYLIPLAFTCGLLQCFSSEVYLQPPPTTLRPHQTIFKYVHFFVLILDKSLTKFGGEIPNPILKAPLIPNNHTLNPDALILSAICVRPPCQVSILWTSNVLEFKTTLTQTTSGRNSLIIVTCENIVDLPRDYSLAIYLW